MGGDPEKLLTLEEAARRLGVPADDVEAMIRQRRLPAFWLGGEHLRIRLRDLETVKIPESPAPRGGPSIGVGGRPPIGVGGRRGSGFRERVADFLYFNDFYLVAFLILLTLLAILFSL